MLNFLRALCLVLFAAVAFVPANALAAPRAHVDTGTLQGVTRNGVRAFLGVPFAAPPVGALRWRGPQPHASWSGVRAAQSFGPSCMQTELPNGVGPWTAEFFPHGAVSEDCLYLNVWAPNARSRTRLPIMVWIPGGGFRNGSGSVPIYDGAALAQRGIIVVTLNYRVGAFGFLAHPDLAPEPDGGIGNYGVRDVLAALRWLQINAAAFGGDPERVTIVGQSAGGVVVHALLASPQGRGLFAGAIIQSSPLAFRTGDRTAAAEAGAAFMSDLGATSIEALRAIPAARVLEASDRASFRPIVDGVVLPVDPGANIRTGPYNDVPTLTGIVAHETRTRFDLAGYQADSASRDGDASADFLALYPASSDAEALEAGLESDRDRVLVGLGAWAQARANRAPTYLYLWTHAEPGPEAALHRAFHSSELAYVFGTFAASPQRSFTAQDRSISETMQLYWTNFIKTGDPNGAGLPAWPRASGDSAPIMELGDRFAPLTPITPERRAFFARSFERSGAFAF
ncbi:MAG: carboxylesterase family protein [Terricaulis sp.]